MNFEISFGKFHYNLPAKEEVELCERTSGSIGLNEAYEGKGWVSESEFYEASKLLHRQLQNITEMLVLEKYSNEDIDFIIGELNEIKHWLRNQKSQKL